MDNLIGEYIFKVLPFEVDFRGKLALPNLTNYILNSAGYHAEERGFGIREINQTNHSWVLSRMAIEITKYPLHYEKIKVQTWVEGIMRSFTLRNFAFLSMDGEVLGYARTIWAMIDQDSRKPVNLSQSNISDCLCDKECPIDRIGKIAPTTEDDLKDSFRVKYSDIDINQHLNSAKYIEHIIDAFSLHKFSKRDITRIEIEYIDECLFDEKINLYKSEISKTDFIIELKNEEGRTVCKSKIRFGEQNQNDHYIKE